jgi:Kef-type K+ transport system membrane component KefB
MNEILSVGLILLAALVAGHLAQLLRAPEVTGYLIIGVLIGPAGFDFISHENLKTLAFLSEIALGLILFGIGSIFEASHFRRVGPGVVRITFWEASTAFVLVTVGLLIAGQAWPLALLLGVIAMETAPATTLMVLHEYDARGPLTDRLLALIALNNMFVLMTFGVVAAVLTLSMSANEPWWLIAYRAVYGLGWSTVGSIALGILLGILLDLWATRARREWGEGMILAMGFVLVAVGAARWFNLSPLFATLALGATLANTSRHGDYLLRALSRADPPLYAAFFVLAGAELKIDSLRTLGIGGLIYVVMRTTGKIGGARLGLRGQDVPEVVRRHLGLCLLSSSSLAIGLTIQIRGSFPSVAPLLTGIVLASVLIFEIAGPLLTRFGLMQAGEARTTPHPLRASGAGAKQTSTTRRARKQT